MQTSKIRKLKAFLVPFLVIIFLCVSEAGIGYLVVPVNSATYLKKEISEYKEKGIDAGIVFLGSSRVYHGFVPEIFEKKLGMDLVINAGSGTQRPESSYYLLRDLYEQVHPRIVVLGIQWNGILKESTDAQRLESAVTACDRMSLKGKMRYVPEYLFSAQLPYFCNMYRHKENFRFDKIKENIEKHKKLDSEGIVVDKNKESYYYGKGFIYSNIHCEAGNIPVMDELQDHFSVDEIDESKVRYIDKIYEFCKKNDIRLILTATPVSMMNMYHIGGYEDAVRYYEEYAEEKGIAFHNLNYLKGREEFITDEMMADYVHLSGDTAIMLSELYADILKQELEGGDVSGYFYRDMESMKADVNRVVALKASVKANGYDSDHIQISALANEGEKILYRVEAGTDDSEESVILCDWTTEKDIDVDIPERYDKLIVKACIEGDESNYAWQEYPVKRAEAGDTE